jgi:imidazole glycerol-phosphate synthase subunit HisH
MDGIIVDAGTGNLHSVFHAVKSLGFNVGVTDQPAEIQRANRIILPGVGAFAKFMEGICHLGLGEPLDQAVRNNIPVLGICVGMQALFELSTEMGNYPGLGFLNGRVVQFQKNSGNKIPHTGWNQLWPELESPLLKGLNPGCFVYFNHSFYCDPSDKKDVAALTDYGGSFTSVVQRGKLFGVQFHPEKSQGVGLRILENFLTL